ncbi:MAG: RHS repeat-associated core domain-containing protein, partial [Bacteroidales bacterium]
GYETQQLVYLPFGEDWVDMKYNTGQYDTPYKFNGKEKDEETGYNNYGARYYYDWASIWLFVDPMSDKYPGTSNYAYCRNNPIMLVDPDGREVGYATDEDKAYVQEQVKTNKKFAEEFKILEEAKGHTYIFQKSSYENLNYGRSKKDEIVGEVRGNFQTDQTLIQYTTNDNPELKNAKVGTSEFRALYEETKHAVQFEQNNRKQQSSCINEAEAWAFSLNAPGVRMYTKEGGRTSLGRISMISNSKNGILKLANYFKEDMYSHLPLFSNENQRKKYEKK